MMGFDIRKYVFITVFLILSLINVVHSSPYRVSALADTGDYTEDSGTFFNWPASQYFYADYSSIYFGDITDTKGSTLHQGFMINKRISDSTVYGFAFDASNNLERGQFGLASKYKDLYLSSGALIRSGTENVFFGFRYDVGDNLYSDLKFDYNPEYSHHTTSFRMFNSLSEKIVMVSFYSYANREQVYGDLYNSDVNQIAGFGCNLFTDDDTMIIISAENCWAFNDDSMQIVRVAFEKRMNAYFTLRLGCKSNLYQNEQSKHRFTTGLAVHLGDCDLNIVVRDRGFVDDNYYEDESNNLNCGISFSMWH